METYSRKEVVEITNPDPSWMNFDVEVFYTKKIITLHEAVNELYTVWDDIEDFERITFIEYAKALRAGFITDIPKERKDKIEEIYSNKFFDSEIFVPCFLCGDLKVLLPDEYPDTMRTPPDVYITEDRNHRLTALALRVLDGEKIAETSVDVFYGRMKHHEL